MTARRTLVMLAGVIAVTAGLSREAGGGQPTFRTDTAGVRVDVLVTRSGTPVENLTREDFEIRDNGVLQAIDGADRTDIDLDVTLALDVSSSVSGARLESLVAAARTLVDRVAPGDRVTLLTFQRRLTLVTSESGDRNAVHRALTTLRAGGATSLRDAVYAGLLLARSPSARALLLVFTDGRDTGSWLDASAVSDAVRASNVVVYGVSAPAGEDTTASAPGALPFVLGDEAGFLEQVAADTGGRVVPSDWTRLDATFRAVLAEFRRRYLLTYQPTNADAAGWHEIEVRLRSGAGDVRARSGYMARPEPH